MRKVRLGRNGPEVSEICLGSMTWGSQNTEAEGHAQIDMALERGITFIDTAEMYPVNPVQAKTVGRTEEIIGTWNARTGRRDEIVIATKVSSAGNKAVRDGAPITPDTIRAAFTASLRRLQTDYIDVYQLHWPNRGSYHFRQNWVYDPSGVDRAATEAHMRAVLETLGEFHEKGQLGYFGLSNETAWGMAMWLRLAEEMGLMRAVSIQNEYSLLCRTYDTDLAELGVNEDVTLLAFSPLAAGFLTGKYQNGQVPDGSRMALNPGMSGRKTDRVFPAVDAYAAIAADYGVSLPALAIAWTLTRPFPTIPIIGATSLTQLEEVLEADGLHLSDAVLAEITEAHRAHPMPY